RQIGLVQLGGEVLGCDGFFDHHFTGQFATLQRLERRLGDEVVGDQLGRFGRLVFQQLDGVTLGVKGFPDGILALGQSLAGSDYHHAGERPYFTDLIDLLDRRYQLGDAVIRLEEEGCIDTSGYQRLHGNRRADAHDVQVTGSESRRLQRYAAQHRIGGTALALGSQAVALEAGNVFNTGFVADQNRVITLLRTAYYLKVSAFGSPCHGVGKAQHTGVQLP